MVRSGHVGIFSEVSRCYLVDHPVRIKTLLCKEVFQEIVGIWPLAEVEVLVRFIGGELHHDRLVDDIEVHGIVHHLLEPLQIHSRRIPASEFVLLEKERKIFLHLEIERIIIHCV
ncbi:MAG: hypothetical protein A4E42_00996 [Methanoregulaceae archaeon PtaU1.Bin222]|nr:MAG: hypothetical protein A4E42_00996 [Methanoregulaceae archaeon PtaU1.Bin222]